MKLALKLQLSIEKSLNYSGKLHNPIEISGIFPPKSFVAQHQKRSVENLWSLALLLMLYTLPLEIENVFLYYFEQEILCFFIMLIKKLHFVNCSSVSAKKAERMKIVNFDRQSLAFIVFSRRFRRKSRLLQWLVFFSSVQRVRPLFVH